MSSSSSLILNCGSANVSFPSNQSSNINDAFACGTSYTNFQSQSQLSVDSPPTKIFPENSTIELDCGTSTYSGDYVESDQNVTFNAYMCAITFFEFNNQTQNETQNQTSTSTSTKSSDTTKLSTPGLFVVLVCLVHILSLS